jgi:hypothetical protein
MVFVMNVPKYVVKVFYCPIALGPALIESPQKHTRTKGASRGGQRQQLHNNKCHNNGNSATVKDA